MTENNNNNLFMYFTVSVVQVFKDYWGDSESGSFIRCQIAPGAVVIWMFDGDFRIHFQSDLFSCLASWCWLLEREVSVPPHMGSPQDAWMFSCHPTGFHQRKWFKKARQKLQCPDVASDVTCYPFCHIPLVIQINLSSFWKEAIYGPEYQPSEYQYVPSWKLPTAQLISDTGGVPTQTSGLAVHVPPHYARLFLVGEHALSVRMRKRGGGTREAILWT